MLAKNSTELVILKLVYVPPNIEIEDPVIVNYHMPDVLSCRTRYLLNWYNNLMAKEYVNIPKGDTVQFCMWRIKTSAAELFTINNIRYDNMLLFVGQENIHWVYFTLVPKFKSAKGITPLTFLSLIK
ncbi:hypothetical protein DOY81_011125 [Sarcophaga bullata]|nr:hypothetical protein DOY81_011125 [Sarcophaga bullata]